MLQVKWDKERIQLLILNPKDPLMSGVHNQILKGPFIGVILGRKISEGWSSMILIDQKLSLLLEKNAIV